MAHFAKLDDNNIVTDVIVVDDADAPTEQQGIDFCSNLFGGRWLQTSYTGKTRNKFAAIGDIYVEESDKFHEVFWINPDTGVEFTEEEWEYLKYYEFYNKTYRFYFSIPADSDDNEILFYCHNNDDYTYVPPDYLTHGTYKIKTEAASWVQHPSSAANFKVNYDFRHDKVLDLGSIGIFVRCSSSHIDPEITDHLRKIHPNYAATSPHELIRLMMEWAYAYEEFGNTEPMATRCAAAITVLQIPQDVKEELLSQVPDQGVARYLKGLEPATGYTRAVMPPLFQEWWTSISEDNWCNVRPIR